MAEQDEIVFDGYAFDFKTGNYRKNDEKAKDLTRFFPILFNELKGKTVSVNRQDDGFSF